MSLNNNLNKILIIDFGSQFTQLIARRIREFGIFSVILNHKKANNSKIFNNNIRGIILSGGPLNVYDSNKFKFNRKILLLNIPVLGICFGHQIISKVLGGKVKKSKFREFGLAQVKKIGESQLIKNFFDKKNTNNVWMSHADHVSKIPKGFQVIASSKNSKFLFQRNIVFNPKDAKSYLYLAKIYNFEENEKEEEKNLNSTLLLESNNEEAMYMLINIYLKKSNYLKIKELKENFSIICSSLCDKTKIINEALKNIEPKNES